jgi:hypothetical protein
MLGSSEKFQQNLPRYRVLVAALILVTIAVCSARQAWYVPWGGDQRVFIHAARLMLHGGDVINIPDSYGLYYVYPPFFAFLNIPLSFLPVGVVIVFWTVASVFLLGWSMAAFYAGMTGHPFFSLPARTRWVVVFFTLVLSARFIIFHLQGGQSDIFVLALAIYGLILCSRKQELRAGIAIGFSIVLKILTLPFVFWFLAQRSKRVLAGIVLGCLVGVMLPAVLVGFEKDLYYHQQWFEKVFMTNAIEKEIPSGVGNLSPRAQLNRFFRHTTTFEYHGHGYRFTIVELPPRVVAVLGWMLIVAIVLAIFWYARRYRNSPTLISQWGGYALVFSLIPSFSTWTEVHHLVLLVPSYLYVVHLWYTRQVTDRWFKVLIVLSFIFLTMTTRTFLGAFLSSVVTSLGFISYGMLLLSAAIFRAANCVESLERQEAGPFAAIAAIEIS